MRISAQLISERKPAVFAAVISLMLAAPMPQAHAQVANTIAFYDFNDGTAKDNSGNGHNGSLSTPSAPTATTGYQGGGFQFSAADNSGQGDNFAATVNLSPSANPELTFGGWFYESGTITPQVGLISNDTGGYCPTLDIDNRGSSGVTWSAFTGSGVLSSGITATPGQWTFVAAVYDKANGIVTIYADPNANGTGLVSASASTSFPTTQEGQTTVTVGRNPNFDHAFNGVMDDVFFVGSALSAAQIQTIASKGQGAFLSGSGASAPEPGSLPMSAAGIGFALLAGSIRRRRKP